MCDTQGQDDFLADTAIRIEDNLETMSDRDILDDKIVEKTIFQTIRPYVKSKFRLRPIVDVHILRT